ncbi:hypothetical protein MPQ_1327 [Methylovorus sp. MP688]|nr:hypothetical protein MPQ_1327 [Methylovorus sp. MP688]
MILIKYKFNVQKEAYAITMRRRLPEGNRREKENLQRDEMIEKY